MGVRRFDGLVWLNSAAIGAPNITRRGVSIPTSGTVILLPPPTVPGVLTAPPPAAGGGRADGESPPPLATLPALAVRSGES